MASTTDEWLSADEFRERFDVSRPWLSKNVFPFVRKLKTENESGKAGRKKLLYNLGDALELIASEASFELYAVPSRSKSESEFNERNRPPRVQIKTHEYTHDYIVGGQKLWRVSEIAKEFCQSDSRELAYRFVYREMWLAVVFGGKVWFIPHTRVPEFVAPLIDMPGAKAAKRVRS